MLENVTNIAQDYSVILVDAYGVFYFGQGVSLGVAKTFAQWVNEGKKVIILSNTTTTVSSTIQNYAKKGVIKGVHYTDIMTSGQYAYETVQQGKLPVKGKRFFVFGTANFKSSEPCPAIFANSQYEVVDDVADADFIYCGIPQIDKNDRIDAAVFEPMVQKLAATKLPMICANPDMHGNEGGRFVVRQGTISAMFKNFGGQVIYFGKPDASIFELARTRFCPATTKDKILMIGDTVRTDILGANRAGIKSCLVLEGGVTEYELIQRGCSLDTYLEGEEGKPDLIAQRVCKAPLF